MHSLKGFYGNKQILNYLHCLNVNSIIFCNFYNFEIDFNYLMLEKYLKNNGYDKVLCKNAGLGIILAQLEKFKYAE